MLITDVTLPPHLADGQGYDPAIPGTFKGARDFERVRYQPCSREIGVAGGFVRRLAPIGRYVLYSPIYLFVGFFVAGLPMAGLAELGVVEEGYPALAVFIVLYLMWLTPPTRRYLKQRREAELLFREGALIIGKKAPGWRWTEVHPEQGENARGHISGTVRYEFGGRQETAHVHDDFYVGPGPVGDEVPVLVHPDLQVVAVFLPTGAASKAKRMMGG